MNISERIEIIKKGCGKYIDNDYCGDTPIEDYLCEKDNLCPTCQALLKQAGEIKDFVKDLNEKFRKDNTPQRLSGDELNNLWEEEIIGKSEGKK